MKCRYCQGPLTRVRQPTGQLNRPKTLTTIYRCIVCGSDIEVAIKRRGRRRMMSALRPIELRLEKKASSHVRTRRLRL